MLIVVLQILWNYRLQSSVDWFITIQSGGPSTAPGEGASRPRESTSPPPPRSPNSSSAPVLCPFFVGVTEGVVTGRAQQQQQSSSVENVLLIIVNYE